MSTTSEIRAHWPEEAEDEESKRSLCMTSVDRAIEDCVQDPRHVVPADLDAFVRDAEALELSAEWTRDTRAMPGKTHNFTATRAVEVQRK